MTSIAAGAPASIEDRSWPERPGSNPLPGIFSFRDLLGDLEPNLPSMTVEFTERDRERDRALPTGRVWPDPEAPARHVSERQSRPPESQPAERHDDAAPRGADGETSAETRNESAARDAVERPSSESQHGADRDEPEAAASSGRSRAGTPSNEAERRDDNGARPEQAAQDDTHRDGSAPADQIAAALAAGTAASAAHAAGATEDRTATTKTSSENQQSTATTGRTSEVATQLGTVLQQAKTIKGRARPADVPTENSSTTKPAPGLAAKSTTAAGNADEAIQASVKAGNHSIEVIDRSLHSKPATTLLDGASLRAIMAEAKQSANAGGSATSGKRHDVVDPKIVVGSDEGKQSDASLLKLLGTKATADKNAMPAVQTAEARSAAAATASIPPALDDGAPLLGSGQQAPAIAGPAGQAAGLQGTMATTASAPGARSTPVPAAAPEQIAVQITKAIGAGKDQVSIRLHPAELGRVDVRLEMSEDGHLRAMITAERSETLELLQRDMRSLERALQQAGLKTDSGSLSFSLRGEGGQQQSSGQDSGRGTGRQDPDAPALPEGAPSTPAGRSSSLHDGSIDITV